MSASETGRSSISSASSYEEIGEYWDTHDLTELEKQGESVEFEVRFPKRHRIAIADELYRRVASESERQGVQPETLVNLWLMERLLPLRILTTPAVVGESDSTGNEAIAPREPGERVVAVTKATHPPNR